LKELDLDVGEDLIVHCGRDSLLSEPSKFKDTIEQLLSIQRFDAIFLDNMEMVLPAKSKGSDDYAYYYKQLPPWAMLATKHNCTILMTHHTKKEREDNPFKTILGSQAIMGCCDSVFVMERSDQPNQFTLHATGKFTEDLALNLKR
jgi:RecA-family ATPase